MRNYRSNGESVRWTNDTGADVSAGDPVVVGGLLGVAFADIANGASGQVSIQGEFELTAAAADAWAQGDEIYYDTAAANVTNVVKPNVAGKAGKAKAAAATTACVLLNRLVVLALAIGMLCGLAPAAAPPAGQQSAIAGGTIPAWRLVKDDANGNLVLASARTDKVKGVSESNAVAGGVVYYAPAGTYSKVLAGGTVSGAEGIVSDANGAGVAVSADPNLRQQTAGTALVAQADANQGTGGVYHYISIAVQPAPVNALSGTAGDLVLDSISTADSNVIIDANGIRVTGGTRIITDGNMILDANGIRVTGRARFMTDGNVIITGGNVTASTLTGPTATGMRIDANAGANFVYNLEPNAVRAGGAVSTAGKCSIPVVVYFDSNSAGADANYAVPTGSTFRIVRIWANPKLGDGNSIAKLAVMVDANNVTQVYAASSFVANTTVDLQIDPAHATVAAGHIITAVTGAWDPNLNNARVNVLCVKE